MLIFPEDIQMMLSTLRIYEGTLFARYTASPQEKNLINRCIGTIHEAAYALANYKDYLYVDPEDPK